MSETLIEFIKDSCRSGKSHAEIREVLLGSGWSRESVDESLARFVDKPYPVAIPKPVVFFSPRLTFLNLFYFLVLYIAIFSVMAILFTFLDYYLPDGLGRHSGFFYGSHRIGEEIRGYLANILCTVPLVWWSSRVLTRASTNASQHIPKARLKMIYFTMFIAACVVLFDAILFIYYFLSGELGIRFVIKVLLLSGLAFSLYKYFRPEVGQTEGQA